MIHGAYVAVSMHAYFHLCVHVHVLERGRPTGLREAIVSTTSFVNVFPTPEVPIRTVGFIA